MKTYLVGGAIRDRMLELPVADRDWLVVGARERDMLARGFIRADQIFPVFLHPDTGEEYALARREIKTGPGYTGFEVDCAPEVTLEQDLRRRDLTINAMAEDENGRLIDLFGGVDDLNQGVLRHVSPAFVEDPVRLLRLARFAARLGRWGFYVAHSTHGLSKRMAASSDLLALRRERLWQEMRQALAEEQPWRFFQVLQRCGALSRLLPELDRAMGEGPAAHQESGPDPVSAALQRLVPRDDDPRTRFACAMCPAARQAGDLAAFSQDLRAERDYAELLELVVLIERRFVLQPPTAAQPLLELIEAARARQQPQRFAKLINILAALHPVDFGPLQQRWHQALEAVLGVETDELLAAGFFGRSLGQELKQRRIAAIERVLMANPI